MACGAIPITSRLYPSVLHSLTKEWDMGPPVVLNVTSAADSAYLGDWLQREWTPAVIRAHRTDREELQRRRRRMAESTRLQYSWANTAAMLDTLFG
jgi:hypothetical protein